MSKKEFAQEIHHRVRRKFPKRKITVFRKDEIWAIDLAQMNAFEKYNNGYKYILCVVDIFSKYAYCVPLKNKTSESVLSALKSIIADSKREPEKIWTDQGSEFYNKHFKEWLNENNIILYSTYGESKSTVVERFILSLKEIITPIFTETNSKDWVTILPDVMKTYNNRIHRTIGMTPTEASDTKNAAEVFLRLSERKKITKKHQPKFMVGDFVRISRQKGIFEKGHEYNFSYEVFKIAKIQDTDPITYLLVDEANDPIEGAFYEPELLKTKLPDYYEVDKILDERGKGKKKELLVSFLGWPAKFNQYIPVDQLYDIPTK